MKIQCPAKINIDLKVLGKRPDGFHDIESTMQTIDLFDYLSLEVEQSEGNVIMLSGNSNNIPYDETNLIYKAAKLFLDLACISDKKISIFIEKNIPVAAGLAGGSTDGAGILYGLNKYFGEIFDEGELNNLCAKLGSDLNVCLNGGRIRATGRGETVEKLSFEEFTLSLIKPKYLGISAKEAYTRFSERLLSGAGGRNKFKNDLEWAILPDYEELQYIKNLYPKSVMTGSGSTYYMIDENFAETENYWVKNGLKTVPFGVKIVE